MNKVLSFFLLVVFSCINFLSAQTDSFLELPKRKTTTSFNYWNFGVGPVLIVPNVGIGHRHYHEQCGYDVSLNLGSIYYASCLQLIANALYIPNPCAENPWYFGIGGAIGIATDYRFSGASTTVSPNFLIGKEISNNGFNKTFIEMQTQIPTWFSDVRKIDRLKHFEFPLMSIKYGMNF